MIKAIVCASDNWSIGRNNDLVFHLKKDMKYFTENTLNKVVVMGENTLLSLPGSKPLKNRVNIVLCPEGHEYEDCICFHELKPLLTYISILASDQDVFIIGGGMMYRTMLPYCQEVLVTKVKEYISDAQVFFPNLDLNEDFELVDTSETFEEDNKLFNFLTYKRVK